jgi:ATP-binding cassette subfamily B multidrug efflux pump
LIQQTFEQAHQDDPTQTMAVIAHRLSTIRSRDGIYVLQKGRVVESGSHDELMQRRGRYYRMNAGTV